MAQSRPVLPRALVTMMFFCFLAACGGRSGDMITEPGPDATEPSPEPEPTLDCDRLAAGYVPCLPGATTVVPGRAVTPPKPWVSLPCNGEATTLVDLFTDGYSPRDIETLAELSSFEQARPGSVCLHLHAFGLEQAPEAVAHLFDDLRLEPAQAWTRLRKFLSEKPYLGMAGLELEGPPAPPDAGLLKQLEEATAAGRRFGVRTAGIFLIGRRTVPEGLTFAAALAQVQKDDDAPPETTLSWTDREPDPEGRIREFSLLCRTRQDWKHRLHVISDCLDRKACPAILSCISGQLYEQEWSETETLDIAEDSGTALLTSGSGPVRLFSWLDPECAHSRELFAQLHALHLRDPRIQLRMDLVAATTKAARVRETLLDPAINGSPDGALCVLAGILSYYPLLEESEIPKMAARCGLTPPVLQNDPKNLKLPVGALPSFCPAQVTPCTLLGTHLLEGVHSNTFLDFGISRIHRELAGSKP
ncbi:hypothetical protein KKD52_05235 [Myxococcota bacterium]|nr:hypothetical protein [Myxococcota bacterium]MBU1412229.1 hypothetical protein [Myxococcota bacterium]MBU1509742.1 hypothetical protein [Myxococcota bacterium]